MYDELLTISKGDRITYRLESLDAFHCLPDEVTEFQNKLLFYFQNSVDTLETLPIFEWKKDLLKINDDSNPSIHSSVIHLDPQDR